jgi:alanyl-tRNA synthetase
LVPENDPTVLFTTAGMHPLVPYLLGEKHPEGKRLVNVQKCVRTNDIDDVGDSTHNTFFEMLGNWSLGDYFKQDSIRWSWEFLTDKKWLGINPQKIKVTVFEGDDDAPRDEESIKIWQECFKKNRINAEVYDQEKKNNESAVIFPLPKKDNWWNSPGETGPCGPDTEIFIDLGRSVNFEKCPNGDDCKPGCNCGRYVEIWNNVFMEYNKTAKGRYVPLEQKNVDTGMGTERTLAVLNGFDNVYETDVFAPIVAQVQSLRHVPRYNEEFEVQNEAKNSKMEIDEIKSIRIIADHIRTSVFMISDGVAPSNLDRGYILRRLLRRAIRHGNLLKMSNGFLLSLAEIVIDIYKESYLELEKNKNIILEEIKKEEEKFERTLERGLKELKKLELIGKAQRIEAGEKMKAFNRVDAQKAFYIFQTFGFPLEMIQEELAKRGLLVDNEEFNEEFKKHQKLSQTASAGKFKGGLADTSKETIKLHTAAHLLLESLRRVLGDHVYQKGSNITTERLRFDFSHPDKLTDEEKQKVENLVNEQIQKNLPVNYDEMSLEEAKKIGAIGVFEAKYGKRVKVYIIGDPSTSSGQAFSKEICGGPHIKNTSELGKFKIKKEQSSGAGVRRIKAVLE